MRMSNHANTANAIINLRVTKDTKRGYGGKIKNIICYLLSNGFAEFVNENCSEICRPLSHRAVMGLFGWLSNNTDLPRGAKKKSKAASTLPDTAIDEFEEEDGVDENHNGIDEVVSPESNVFSGFGDSYENVVDLTTVTISASCMQGNAFHTILLCVCFNFSLLL